MTNSGFSMEVIDFSTSMKTPPPSAPLSFLYTSYPDGKISLDLIASLVGLWPGLIPFSQYSVPRTISGFR